MGVAFDVAGRVGLTVTGADADAVRALSEDMDPCPVAGEVDRPAGLTIACGATTSTPTELLNPARDGLTTATVAAGHALLARGGVCVLPRHDSPQLTVKLGEGLSPSAIMRSVIRPALQVSMLDADAVAMHGACVALDGAAVVVGGWSETGKTEVALALMELGGTFISDKWTAVGEDRAAGTFPITVGVRRWVLDALPTLRDALPGSARMQMTGARVVDTLTAPIRRFTPGRVGRMLSETIARGVKLADRVALTPTEIADAYGHTIDAAARTPLGTVVMLATSPDGPVQVDEVDAAWAARRFARTAQYERREYFELIERARYGDVDTAPPSLRQVVEQREQAALMRILDGVRVLQVRLPFPSDPRPAAAAIAERIAG